MSGKGKVTWTVTTKQLEMIQRAVEESLLDAESWGGDEVSKDDIAEWKRLDEMISQLIQLEVIPF